MLEITTLGRLAIELDGAPVTDLHSRKVEALLVYLAITGRPHPREVLADMFWDDLPQAQAMANLRVALTSLKKHLEPYVEILRETVAIRHEQPWTLDARLIEQAVDDAAGQVVGDGLGNIRQLEAALQLYQGDFLAGIYLQGARGFEEWATIQRENIRRTTVRGYEILADDSIPDGDLEKGVAYLESLLALDPFREDAHRQLMAVYAGLGQRGRALQQYEACRGVLEEELGIEPAEETEALLERIKNDEPFEELASARLSRAPRVVGESPYRGLAAFREGDAAFFFGREMFAEQLVEAITSRNFVSVIIGPSGSGKSSVAAAGLLPELREQADWLILQLRPGAEPFYSLASALVPHLQPELDEIEQVSAAQRLADGLQAGEISLNHTINRVLNQTGPISEIGPVLHAPRRLLLILDQLEELFTLVPDQNLRHGFLDEMLAAVGNGAGQGPKAAVFLLTLRADFMAQALAHRGLADALQAGSLLLGPMTREELQDAVEKPAELQGAAFEPGLVARILDDVGQEPGSLPLLEFALTLLWDRLDQGWMTHAAYDEIGRVQGALARYADEVYTDLKPDEQDQARRAFVQLVQPGQGTEDTRRVARRENLVGVEWGLVQRLADERLVVTSIDAAGDETVEVVHEALIRGWGQLRDWMEADRAFRGWQEGLRASLRAWEDSGRDEGALLRGVPLAQAQEWSAVRSMEISAQEIEFIRQSVAFQEQRQAVRERRRRLIIGGLAVGLVVAVLLSVFAFGQRGVAERNARLANQNAATATAAQGDALGQAATAEAERLRAEDEADGRATQQALAESESLRAEGEAQARATQQALAEETARTAFSRELAAAAVNSLDSDPERGILLALAGLEQEHTLAAEEALRQAIRASPLRRTSVITETGNFHMTASPDGKTLFVSDLGGGTLWDTATGETIFTHVVPEEDWINRADFTPDGAYIVMPEEAHDEDGNEIPGEVTIIDARNGEERMSFVAHDRWVQHVDVSPDGQYFATGSGDLTVKIWDLVATLSQGAGVLVHELCCLETWQTFDFFSPDSSRLVTTDGLSRARVWDVATGEELFEIGPDILTIAY
ncbi:MAG: BTAD domain-containing putative transcriptional regulator, partial [Anaerolineales bacterium]|nr:BTAD domain-containing putative transcriptional regulator [Anaerolineales bacterium]